MKNLLRIFLWVILVSSIQLHAQTKKPTLLVHSTGSAAPNATIKAHGTEVSKNTVAVNLAGTKTGCVAVTVFPWTEGFNIAGTIPDCWTQADHQGNGQIWQFGTIAGTDIDPILSGNYAYLNSDGYGSGNSQNVDLISPSLDLSALPNVTIRFNHYFRSMIGSAGTLSYSLDDGTSWTIITTFLTNSTTNPEVFSQLIAAAAGQSNVKFKWNYTGEWAWYWAIDDIAVFEVPAHDVSAFTVDMTIEGEGNVTPKATVKNLGASTETFPVTMTIGTYTSTKTVTSLSSGASQQVTFDPWTAAAGDYTVQICTQLDGDLNPGNDCKSKLVSVLSCPGTTFPILESFEGTVFPPMCWSISSISGTNNWVRSTAASGFGAGVSSALARFPGQSSGTSYELKSMLFDISGLTYPTLTFNYAYASTVNGPVDQMDVYYSTDGGATNTLLLAMPGGAGGILNTGGETNLLFIPAASQWGTQILALPAGTNQIKFRAISARGNNLYLDDVMVFENLAHDVSALSVDLATVITTGNVTPKATVKNLGANTETFPVTMTIGTYTSTQTVTALPSGASRQVTFDPWTAAKGDYSVQVCTQLADDVNSGNDCKSQGAKVLNLNIQVYGYNAYPDSGTDPSGPTTFNLSDPGTLNSIADQGAMDFVAGGTWAEGVWYGTVYRTEAPYEFISINPTTGERTVIGATTVCLNGISYNTADSTMYGIEYNGTNSNLYSINLPTGANTFIGNCGTSMLINLAINDAGLAYAVDIVADVLGTINLATGTFNVIGPIGFNANYAQDMEFDRVSGELYMAACSTSGWLSWVNQNTGATVKIGDFEGGAEVTGLAIPYQISQKKLSAGWTWFSLNVSKDDMSVATVLSSLKPSDGDYIKNQTVSSTYYEGTGWFGELTWIDPREMYKIKLAKADTLSFNGMPVDLVTNPITIQSGWNWIGYLPQSPKPITEALSSMVPVGDDYIKNQTESSTFYEGSGWFGELTDLEPMDGYMLKTSHTGTLTYPVSGGFTDERDGNAYRWVKIGDQTWMTRNLDWLPTVSPSASGSETDPYYYVYGYEGSTVSAAKATANYGTYGALYNWPAALTACLSGWHLPTDEEWKILEKNLGMSQSDADAEGVRTSGTVGGKLKETGTMHWTSPNSGATNNSGFTALPGGYAYNEGFGDLGHYADFWSASENGTSDTWYRNLGFDSDGVGRYKGGRFYGFSVRCLQNE